jgi:hypothetical protein
MMLFSPLVKKINGETLHMSTAIPHLFLIWENSCLSTVPPIKGSYVTMTSAPPTTGLFQEHPFFRSAITAKINCFKAATSQRQILN